MSARFSLFLVAGFCLFAMSACDSRQAPATEAPAAANSPAVPIEAPVTTPAPETPAPVDTFLLETAAKAGDTLQTLRSRYGEANVIEGELPGAEGETAQGWIIFPNDPEKKLMIYTDESNTHPGSLLVDEATSKWHLANSIKMGSDSTALHALNQKAFTFYGFYWDYGGVITDWNGGAMGKKTADGLHINIHLCPPENPKLPDNYLSGDGTFNSDNPWAIKFPPVVCKLGVYFPMEEKK